MPIIRKAKNTDIPEICAVYTDFYAFNAFLQPAYYVALKEDGTYPKTVIEGNNGDIMVAKLDRVVVGLLHIQEDQTQPYPSVASHKFASIIDFTGAIAGME